MRPSPVLLRGYVVVNDPLSQHFLQNCMHRHKLAVDVVTLQYSSFRIALPTVKRIHNPSAPNGPEFLKHMHAPLSLHRPIGPYSYIAELT